MRHDTTIARSKPRPLSQLVAECFTTTNIPFPLNDQDCTTSQLSHHQILENVWQFMSTHGHNRHFVHRLMSNKDTSQQKIQTAELEKHSGNELFRQHSFEQALVCFTRALSVCPVHSTRLRAILFTNRSAALTCLGQYEEAYRDTCEAICSGDYTYAKAWFRRSVVMEKGLGFLGVFPTAQESRSIAQLLIECPEVGRDVARKGKMDMLSKFDSKKANPAKVECFSAPGIQTLESKTTSGRGLYSSRTSIERGTTLIREEPLAHRLNASYRHTRCSYCLESSSTLIPCGHCNVEMYCSRECKYQALEKCHVYECPVVQNLPSMIFARAEERLALWVFFLQQNQGQNFVPVSHQSNTTKNVPRLRSWHPSDGETLQRLWNEHQFIWSRTNTPFEALTYEDAVNMISDSDHHLYPFVQPQKKIQATPYYYYTQAIESIGACIGGIEFCVKNNLSSVEFTLTWLDSGHHRTTHDYREVLKVILDQYASCHTFVPSEDQDFSQALITCGFCATISADDDDHSLMTEWSFKARLVEEKHIKTLVCHQAERKQDAFIELCLQVAMVIQLNPNHICWKSSQETKYQSYLELVKTVCQMDVNAHGISQCVVTTDTIEQQKVGLGCYPTAAAMMNHSCAPNCVLKFVGTELQVIATQTIEANAELTISYGPHFAKMKNPVERKACLMDQYYFDCQCGACRDERSSDTLLQALNCLACPDGELISSSCETMMLVHCHACKQEYQLEELREILQGTTVQRPAEAYFTQRIETLSKLLGKSRAHVQLAKAHDQYAEFLAQNQQFHKAATSCQRSIDTLLALGTYSIHDIEIAYEMVKLASLYFHAHAFKECQSVITEARKNVCPGVLPPELEREMVEMMQATCI